MLYSHRLKTPLEKGIHQGKRFFFIYGDGIKDCFLEGLYEGIYTLHETLRNYFLNKNGCTSFVLANTDGVQVSAIRNGEICDISEEFLTPKKVEDEMPDEDEGIDESQPQRKESEESKKLQESMQSSGVNIVNHIHMIKARAAENQDRENKIVIFFEDFEWLAKLYSSNNEASLEYIKILKDFMKLDDCYVLVSLEDMELLKKYHFEMKGSNIIFLGNPSAKEIKYAFLRRFLKNTTFDKAIQENLLNELDEIAQAMSSGKKSLREATQVFDTLVLEQDKKRVEKTDFEIAIEKITAEKVLLKDVIIEETEKQKIINAVDAFIENDDTREYRKGFILTGPPGTGKTQIVKAIANEKNCYFMAPTLSDLKGEYVGHSSAKVKRVFDEARANAPTIIFVDEADTVFPSRDIGSGGSDSFNLDMVNQFLQEVDGMTSGKEKIFVIAATNRPNIIDAAVQSRLTERIPINLPSAPNRIRIFDNKLKKYDFSIGDKSYRSEIESKTVNMSGRDIENFVKKLKEKIVDTPFLKISNLGDNEESKKVLFNILEDNERMLIDDLQRSVPVQISEPPDITMRYQDIIGYESIKMKIARQGEFIRASEEEKQQAKRFGIKMSKGVLLYGPPGNAKTKLAEAVAKENNFYFIKVLSKDFISDSIARQLDNLQMIFDQALRLSKLCSKYEGVLLFFDEFDSLAGKMCLDQRIRGTLLDYLASGEKEDRTGIRSAQSRILLMAATNYYEFLDEAVIRKGRIDEHMLLDNPSEEAGKMMLAQMFDKDPRIRLSEPSLAGLIYNYLLEYTRSKHPVLDKEDEKEREQREHIRPSGSEIMNCFHEIKAETYFEQKSGLKKDAPLIVGIKQIEGYFYLRTGCDFKKA